jgi:phenylacetate-CoA ligase
MTTRQPQPGDLEPIETASRDEISALQLQRLQWTLPTAYDNVATSRRSALTAKACTRAT